MPEYREEFDLHLPLEAALLACKTAVAELDWKISEEGSRRLVCKEPQEVLSFNWAATAELSLSSVSSDKTRVSINASNFGWGRLQKNHLKGQVGNLRNKVAVAASKPDSSAPVQRNADLSSELEKLADLHARGLLSEEEFRVAKARLLGN